ncbi:MAG: 4Fe-4S binding protein [Actinobacteria bacterium]|nr:4Fe-4S binding protein [Actinomycetota bacterium]
MLYIDKNSCTGCKLCVKNCPNGAINIISGKAHIDMNMCSECLRCVYVCPRSAIKHIKEPDEEIAVAKKFQAQDLNEILVDLQKRITKVRLSLDRIEKKKRYRVS